MNKITNEVDHPLLLEAERLDAYLLPVEVAEILHVSVNTLAVWRSDDRYDLPYIKIGGRVRYTHQAVRAFASLRLNSRSEK